MTQKFYGVTVLLIAVTQARSKDEGMTTYAIVNLKGGTTKTTSAAFLAHAFPKPTLCVDADAPGSLLRWSEFGDWDIPVVGMPVKDIHKRLPGISRDYKTVVIDTPPLEEQAGVVYSALRAADVAVITVAPTMMEMDRLSPILTAIDEVAPLRDRAPIVRVLLTRVDGRSKAGSNVREALSEAGLEVVQVNIPLIQRYAQAFSKPVKDEMVPGDPYETAAKELEAAAKAGGVA